MLSPPKGENRSRRVEDFSSRPLPKLVIVLLGGAYPLCGDQAEFIRVSSGGQLSVATSLSFTIFGGQLSAATSLSFTILFTRRSKVY